MKCTGEVLECTLPTDAARLWNERDALPEALDGKLVECTLQTDVAPLWNERAVLMDALVDAEHDVRQASIYGRARRTAEAQCVAARSALEAFDRATSDSIGETKQGPSRRKWSRVEAEEMHSAVHAFFAVGEEAFTQKVAEHWGVKTSFLRRLLKKHGLEMPGAEKHAGRAKQPRTIRTPGYVRHLAE